MLPLFPLARLGQPTTWTSNPRIAAAHRVLDHIPDGATVAASNRLVPQLTSRTTVSEFGLPGRRPVPEWIVVDTATPQGRPVSRAQQARDIDAARARGYRTAIDRDGYLLLRRP
ncbi:DUF2079 domain-containing protein [Streptomyces sp. NPDC002730]|uniref:DUF2079 domain-containing protein n=1 Tax=Streptomyces sp. NPDC002730 TaxID=3364662 RepID=UPI0036A1C927